MPKGSFEKLWHLLGDLEFMCICRTVNMSSKYLRRLQSLSSGLGDDPKAWSIKERTDKLDLIKIKKFCTIKDKFPGGPVVRTQCFHCRGLSLIASRGTKILQAVQHVKKKKKKKALSREWKVKGQATDWEDIFAKDISGASLVAQWLGIRLPMQGTWVQALVREDPTCRGAAGPMCHYYRSRHA